MKRLGAIQWKNPAIFGPIAAAIVGGLFLIISTCMNSDVGEPLKLVLPKQDLEPAFSKAVDPLREDMAAGFKALGEQLAQLEPKQTVPDTGDPLKIKAVEFYNAGRDAYAKGEIDQALGHWLDTVALDPDNAAAHNNLSVVLEAKGHLVAAIEHLRAAVRIDPDYARAHYNLGIALKAKGDLDAAIEHYNAALRIDPDDAKAHCNLGIALAAKGDHDAAIESYNAALRIDPDFAKAHNNLGNALKAKGEFDAAIEQYNAALRIDPDYEFARNNLNRALAAKAKLDPDE